MSLHGSFLSLHSALFTSEPRRAAKGEDAPASSPFFLGGTDAEYAASGIPERQKTQCHWLGVWNDETEVDGFLSSVETHIPRLREAKKFWGLKLIPYMRRGAEIFPIVVGDTKPEREEPIVIITSIGPYSREIDAAVAGQRASYARGTLSQADGLLQELVLIPYPPTDLFTVTAWANERAAQAWAYRSESHRSAIDFHKKASEKARVSFTRCRIDETFGDWKHRSRVP